MSLQSWLGHRAAVSLLAAASLCLIGPRLAQAVDEIQVYNGDINEVGQFSIQQHLNYTIEPLAKLQQRAEFPALRGDFRGVRARVR